ncbi:MAG: hypothetical protein ABGZ35_29885 [Planctomycetaceae bacterium]
MPVTYRWCRRWGVPEKDTPAVLKRVFRTLHDSFRTNGTPDQTFLGFLWGHARYHAAEHPRVQSMGIPDRYPDDVPQTMVTDDALRLTRSATDILIRKHPADTHVIFERLFDRGQTATTAAAQLPFTLDEIRRRRNMVLRELRACFGNLLTLNTNGN